MKSFSKVRIVGPLRAKEPGYAEIIAFRTAQNQKRAPYLEQAEQHDIERRLRIDDRSLHFALERDGAIVACLRVTPAPFELSELSPVFAGRAAELGGYYEFGRLCTDSSLESKGFYAGMLVVKAAHYVFKDENALGIVGVCRNERVSYMEKLGLRADASSVRVASRQSDYRLIQESKDGLLRFYFNRFYPLFSRAPRPAENGAEVSHESRTA